MKTNPTTDEAINRVKEIWKDVIGFEEHYMISNHGNLKSKHRFVKRKNSLVLLECKPIKKQPYISNKGYKVHDLYKNTERKKELCSRLVAFHFVDNPNNKPFVNHIDSNPLNDYFENLEWTDQFENMQHSAIFGNIKRTVSKDQVLFIFNSCESRRIIQEITGISKSTIARIKRGEQYCDYTGFYSEKKYNGNHYFKQQGNRKKDKTNTQSKLF